jgi:hypothetical protein
VRFVAFWVGPIDVGSISGVQLRQGMVEMQL